LVLHADGACFIESHRPQFLALAGLVNDERVSTALLPVTDVLRSIPDGLRREVETPQFTFGVPTTFGLGAVKVGVIGRSIIYYDNGGYPHIALPSVDFPQETTRANKALREFRSYVASLPPRWIPVERGRVLIFDNTKFLHGRDKIADHHRWLQRIYFRLSLDDLRRADPNSLNSRFSIRRLLFS
jgi:hypothetical protein